MNESDLIIKLEHVSKTFNGVKVLDDVSLDIKKGEFVTLLGPSGCGKTTTLRIIAGFRKPDEGRLFMDGRDISEVPPYRRPLNTVFQRYALFPNLDVFDNVAFGLKLKNTPQEEINKRVKKVLKLVSMSDYEDRDVDSLSGGQQQRVAIARALVNDPVILLADEATGNLDTRTSYEIMSLFQDLHHQGKTIAFVTHEPDIANFTTRKVALRDGQIIEDAAINTQSAAEALAALNLQKE